MNTVIQTFTGPLFALFLLGMFSERARGGPVLFGGCVGTVVALYLSQTKLWGELLGRLLGQGPIDLPGSGIGFIWPTVFGFAATWIVSYALSLVMPGRATEQQCELTWRNVMKRRETDDTTGAATVTTPVTPPPTAAAAP